MPGEDESRERERQALLVEAEKHLEEGNKARATIIMETVMDQTWQYRCIEENEENTLEIFKYINRCDTELLRFAEKYPLQQILMRLNIDPAIVPDGLDESHEWFQAKMEILRIGDMHDWVGADQLSQISDDLRFRDELAQLRSLVLLHRHFKQDSIEALIKERFLHALGKIYLEHGLDLPPQLRLMLTPEVTSQLIAESDEESEDVADSEQFLIDGIREQRLDEEISTGTHPEFAQRRVQREDEFRRRRLLEWMGRDDEVSTAKIQAQLAQLLADYPDPKVLVDKILDLKDGTLPI